MIHLKSNSNPNYTRGFMLSLHVVLVSLLLHSPQLFSSDTQKRTAVLDLTNRADLQPQEVDYLTSIVRGTVRGVLPTSQYILMTRENIMELLPAGSQLSNCLGDCAVETGRNIGADYVITGEVVKFADELRAIITLHKTDTGNLIIEERVGAGDLKNLESAVEEASITLAKSINVNKPHVKQISDSLRITPRIYYPIGMTMKEIPAGAFTMGSPSHEENRDIDEAEHRVVISRPFYISTTEVTQKQWRTVMGKNPSEEKLFMGDHPVNQVSWYDCIAFCNKLSSYMGLQPVYIIDGSSVNWDRTKLGYRLPTEAEWEYSCRAGSSTSFCNGNSAKELKQVCVYFDYSFATIFTKSLPVGCKAPNAWGLFDMHGNVWEWCWDGFSWYDDGELIDPVVLKPLNTRVVRGGSWRTEADQCRSANRRGQKLENKAETIGLRICLDHR